ncbi:hypothetical protein ASF32_00045 [Methylobacterium sp. Leaf91]|nr:hypothetical protein ASF32_00045 [Methylobacterium sp. Leaf91]
MVRQCSVFQIFPIAATLRLSTGAQRPWWFNALIISPQKHIDLDTECARQSIQDIDSRVYQAAFDTTEVRRGHASIDGKSLLRQPTYRTQLPDIPSKACPSIHGPQARRYPRLIHDVYDKD